MNAREQLIFIANNILPLEAKHDCHIFIRYWANSSTLELDVAPNKFINVNSDNKYFRFKKGEAIGEKDVSEVEAYIVETKLNAKAIAQKRLEEIEKEKEALLKQIEGE